MKQSIPVVDLRDYRDPATRDAFTQALGDALRELGFVAIEGYGIPDKVFDRAYASFEAFFALDDATKRRYERADSGRRRGYTSFGVEHAKDSHTPDLKEFFHVGRDDASGKLPENVWPDDVVPSLKRDSKALYDALDQVWLKILASFSTYLGLSADHLPDMARGGNTVQRYIHYPVCDGFDQPGAMRAAQHEDINLMTLLPPSAESGLELLTKDGQWLPIHAIPGQIILDTGDMMMRITNDHIPATTHRVVNPQGEPTPRYSMPFFVHPHLDVTLEVLQECLAPGESPKYPPIHNEAFLNERLEAIGVKSK